MEKFCFLKKYFQVSLSFFLILLNGCWWTNLLTGKTYLPLKPDQGLPHTPIYYQGDWIIARASLHNHTLISDGRNQPEDLVKLARREGIAILAITDHREGEIQTDLGLKFPINGIEKIGYQEYFNRLIPLKQKAEANHDLILLIGAEVNPYLYNIGRFPALVILNQNNHFIIYNINDPEVLSQMPAWRKISLKPQDYPRENFYQKWVDYIVEHNGIVFVAHPASDQSHFVLGIRFFSEPPINNVRLKNITGFSSLTESYGPEFAGAGGVWDSVLSEYLAGMRAQPIWTLADCDYHGNETKTLTTCGNTLFYLHEFSEEDVYQAMKQGRMVAFAGEMFQNFYVAEFSVSNGTTPQDLIMFGKEIKLAGPPVVRFRLDHQIAGVKTILIRNGKVIKEVEGSSLEFVDQEIWQKKTPAYYRIQVAGPFTIIKRKDGEHLKPNIIFTNPIFVRF